MPYQYKSDENGAAICGCYLRNINNPKKGFIALEEEPEDLSAYDSGGYKLEKLLKSQKSTCIQLRKGAEYHFSQNPRFKDPKDIEKWRVFCEEIDSILESDIIQEIPTKPFS